MCQSWKKPSPSSLCCWVKISVKWIMRQKHRAPHNLVAKQLTLSQMWKEGRNEYFLFWWLIREIWVFGGQAKNKQLWNITEPKLVINEEKKRSSPDPASGKTLFTLWSVLRVSPYKYLGIFFDGKPSKDMLMSWLKGKEWRLGSF